MCDPDTEKGRQLVYNAINFYESSKITTRVALIVQKSNESKDDLIKKAILYAMNNLNKKQSFMLIKRLLKEKNFNDLKSGKKTISNLEFKVENIMKYF